MEERVGRLERFTQISVELHAIMEESQRQMREDMRRMQESQRRMDELQQRRDELMGQMMQAIALIQGDIVRIDEGR